jgi:hypothetical protein
MKKLCAGSRWRLRRPAAAWAKHRQSLTLLCIAALLLFSQSAVGLQIHETGTAPLAAQLARQMASTVAATLLEAIPDLSGLPRIGADAGSGKGSFRPPPRSLKQSFNKAAKSSSKSPKPPKSGWRSWFGGSKTSVAKVQRPRNVQRTGQRSGLLKWWRSNRSKLRRQFSAAAAPRAATRAAQQRGTASIARYLSRVRASKTPLGDAKRGAATNKQLINTTGRQEGSQAQRSAQERGISLLSANKGKERLRRGKSTYGWLKRWEKNFGEPLPPGHTIKEHVKKRDSYLADRLKHHPTKPRASTFPNRKVAERAIARAIRYEREVSRRPPTSQAFRKASDPQQKQWQKEQRNFQAWLRRKKTGSQFVIRYTDSKPVGRVMTRDGKIHETNTVQVVLRMRPNGRYYIETAYPDI